MYPTRVKVGAFVLEGMNALSTTFYFYFVYWFLKSEFGFGSMENLLWAVASGGIYIWGSLKGGNYGQRRGYLRAMALGFGTLGTCFFLGWVLHLARIPRTPEIALQAVLMLTATVGMCYTWPNLEALVSEGEPGPRLQRYLGIYNLVWSGAGALAYFSGGALIAAWGAPTTILLLPAILLAGQVAITFQLVRWAGGSGPKPAAAHGHDAMASEGERHRSSLSPRAFLKMSWLANPCAYVAINTAVPLIPTLADRLGLDTRTAGFFCSIWLFVRTATFLGLWQWNGWHYRFKYLGISFVGMIAGFLLIFLSAGFTDWPQTRILVVASVAQVVFGISVGLIYYSSLFYSMDVGTESKGDHGGIHEAAIGVGICAGPLVGSVAQFVRPGSTTAAAWAVSAVLAVGFVVLLQMRRRGAGN